MFTLSIDQDNAAFDENKGAETARILRELADVVESEGDSFVVISLYDSNGNYVGQANDIDKPL